MKTKLMAGVLGAALAIGVPMFAQATADSSEHDSQAAPTEPHHRGNRMQKLSQELNLTADQQAKIKPIFQQARAQGKTIHQDASLTKEQKMAKMKELHQTTMAQMNEILTPNSRRNGSNCGSSIAHSGSSVISRCSSNRLRPRQRRKVKQQACSTPEGQRKSLPTFLQRHPFFPHPPMRGSRKRVRPLLLSCHGTAWPSFLPMIYFVSMLGPPHCETLTYSRVVADPVRFSPQHALVGAGGAAGNTGREFHAANAANAGDLHYNTAPGTAVVIVHAFADEKPVRPDRSLRVDLTNLGNHIGGFLVVPGREDAVFVNTELGKVLRFSNGSGIPDDASRNQRRQGREANVEIVIQRDPAAITLNKKRLVSCQSKQRRKRTGPCPT